MDRQADMLSHGDLVAFLPTDDLDRARRFFSDVIALPLVEDTPFGCVFDNNGTALRVTPVAPFARPPHTVLGWTVADIAAEIRTLAARGVQFERYEGMPQDASGVWLAPDGDLVAWFKDPDGNTLSLTQPRHAG
jgi:catechol 2,3-dioxygenase-like lactoylglutathione lyase family enzyme